MKHKSKKYEYENETLLLLNRGKRTWLKILTGRAFILTVIVLLQVFLLFEVFFSLGKYVLIYSWVSFLLSVVMVIMLVNRNSNMSFKVTWLALFAIFPAPAAVLYLYLEADLGFRTIRSRLGDIIIKTDKFVPYSADVESDAKIASPALSGLARYAKRCGNAPICRNISARYYKNGEEFYNALISDLRRAKKYIFLEYFIISEGYMWGSILKVLKDKVDSGVEVRVMYDGMCAFVLLPYNYPKRLGELGIKCKMFSPIRPVLTSAYNNRDHRKIAVIDGQIAYTGGANLSDEYMNITHPHGTWKDAAARVEGDAARYFTLSFLQMWNIDESGIEYEPYLEQPRISENEGGFVIPYCDSPLDDELFGRNIYIDILNTAQDYVYIMTPYLIPDGEFINAVTFAAKRGVDVRLITPRIPDKKYIFMLTRSYYSELQKAGVKIYEYLPGFIHSKVFLSDNMKAVVGTVNIDYRSLYLHFEDGIYFYDVPMLADIKRDFEETIPICEEMTPLRIKNIGIISKLIGRLMKLIAPLV